MSFILKMNWLLPLLIASIIAATSAAVVPVKGGRPKDEPLGVIVENAGILNDYLGIMLDSEKKQEETQTPTTNSQNKDETTLGIFESVLTDIKKSASEEHNHKDSHADETHYHQHEVNEQKQDTTKVHEENHNQKDLHSEQHIHKKITENHHQGQTVERKETISKGIIGSEDKLGDAKVEDLLKLSVTEDESSRRIAQDNVNNKNIDEEQTKHFSHVSNVHKSLPEHIDQEQHKITFHQETHDHENDKHHSHGGVITHSHSGSESTTIAQHLDTESKIDLEVPFVSHKQSHVPVAPQEGPKLDETNVQFKNEFEQKEEHGGADHVIVPQVPKKIEHHDQKIDINGGGEIIINEEKHDSHDVPSLHHHDEKFDFHPGHKFHAHPHHHHEHNFGFHAGDKFHGHPHHHHDFHAGDKHNIHGPPHHHHHDEKCHDSGKLGGIPEIKSHHEHHPKDFVGHHYFGHSPHEFHGHHFDHHHDYHSDEDDSDESHEHKFGHPHFHPHPHPPHHHLDHHESHHPKQYTKVGHDLH